jgi:TetR/AcrR family transcriptional regulator, mexJK operon transcriptional repressor
MLKSLTADSSSRRARMVSAKRRAILRAAKAAFLKCGFEGATMDAVAERARVSKMTVYRHFEDKETLFAGVITELCAQINGENFNTLFTKAPQDALRDFARRMIAIVFAHETVELHRIVIAECQRFPKLGRLFYESGPEASIRALAEYLARNQGDPGLKVRDARRSAEEFLELLRGYAHLRVILGLQKAPSAREISQRINAAIDHVMA